MSKTYHLVCPETKTAIWVGQGDYIYSGWDYITATAKWLHQHKGKPLVFCESQEVPGYGVERKDWVGMEDDTSD